MRRRREPGTIATVSSERIHVALEVERGVEPITGFLQTPSGGTQPFTGWLELTQLLEAIRASSDL
jgi:hypothetical protein